MPGLHGLGQSADHRNKCGDFCLNVADFHDKIPDNNKKTTIVLYKLHRFSQL